MYIIFKDNCSLMDLHITNSELQQLVTTLYGIDVHEITALTGYCDKNYHIKSHNEYVLKITTDNFDVLQLQNSLMAFLHKKGFPVPYVIPSKEGDFISTYKGFQVRLFSYLSGKSAVADNYDEELLRNIGTLLGKMDLAVQEFNHPQKKSASFFDVQNFLQLQDYLDLVSGDETLLIKKLFCRYEEEIIHCKKLLRRSMVHNDVNEFNVLSTDAKTVSGIIDFGDFAYTYHVNNLAITLTHYLLRQRDVLGNTHIVYQAYNEVFSLTEEEKNVLPLLVRCRLVTLILLGLDAIKDDQEDEYVQQEVAYSRKALKELSSWSDKEMMAAFRREQ